MASFAHTLFKAHLLTRTVKEQLNCFSSCTASASILSMDPKLLSKTQRDINPVRTQTRPLFGCTSTALRVCSGLMVLTPVDRCAKKAAKWIQGYFICQAAWWRNGFIYSDAWHFMPGHMFNWARFAWKVKNDHNTPWEKKGQRERKRERDPRSSRTKEKHQLGETDLKSVNQNTTLL